MNTCTNIINTKQTFLYTFLLYNCLQTEILKFVCIFIQLVF